jgi:hypothetical protein
MVSNVHQQILVSNLKTQDVSSPAIRRLFSHRPETEWVFPVARGRVSGVPTPLNGVRSAGKKTAGPVERGAGDTREDA